MTLNGHHEGNKDQKQGKMEAKHLKKAVSRQQTNLGITRDEWGPSIPNQQYKLLAPR